MKFLCVLLVVALSCLTRCNIICERAEKVVSELLGVSQDHARESSSLRGDLGADEMEIIDLAMALSYRDNKWATVEDICDFIRGLGLAHGENVKSQEQHVLTLGGTGSICVDVRNIIARFKDIPLDKVTENSRLVIDLRVTPTDRFYIISRVKTKFGIKIPRRTADGFGTVKDICDYVVDHRNVQLELA